MDREKFGIIRAFLGDLRELTINQLSKKVRKSYAFTNKYAHELIKEGVLNKKEIGHSILCTLNLKSKKTLAALIFISISESSSEPKNGIIIEYSGKKIAINKEFLKMKLKGLDISRIKVISGHEEFWRLYCEVAE